jgi:hypothetical protein
VDQARAEARAAEEAAEQRIAAALALERAELDKQVQLSLFVRQRDSAALPWPASAEGACGGCMRQTMLETAAHAMRY